MEKRLLLIMNPRAGQKRANRYLPDMLRLFSDHGCITTAYMTGGQGDAAAFVRSHAKESDLIVAVGGDGTLNETVNGLLASGVRRPIGYIPAGSTNDFASSLKLPTNIMEAAKAVMEGTPRTVDVGDFNGRSFTYVASFGAFTETSYTTPQEIKNVLGRFAYILEGVKDLANIRPIPMRLVTDTGDLFEGDFIFGAISNTTSIGGLMTMPPARVIMDDGLFEITLIKMPTTATELGRILTSLQSQQYDAKVILTSSASRITVHSPNAVPWTLDGEYAKGETDILVENLHNAFELITRSN